MWRATCVHSTYVFYFAYILNTLTLAVYTYTDPSIRHQSIHPYHEDAFRLRLRFDVSEPNRGEDGVDEVP